MYDPAGAGAATATDPAGLELENPAVEKLLHQDVTIDDAALREVLALGEPAIPDLEQLLDHACAAADTYADRDEADTWFATHALFLLGELRASRSLPAVLRFLAQDETALEDWLGDVLFEELFCAISGCVGERFDEIRAFLTDRSVYAGARSAVCQALISEAAKDSSRRDAAVAVVRAFLADARARAEDIELDEMEEFALYDVVRFCARAGLTELEEPIVALFRSEVIPEYIMSVEDYLDIPPSPIRSTSVFDAYARIRSWPSGDEAYDEMEPDDDARDLERAEAGQHYGEHSYVCCSCGYEQPHPGADDPVEQPYRRPTPKVGRNEPCPCRSGKKYKRCCGA